MKKINMSEILGSDEEVEKCGFYHDNGPFYEFDDADYTHYEAYYECLDCFCEEGVHKNYNFTTYLNQIKAEIGEKYAMWQLIKSGFKVKRLMLKERNGESGAFYSELDYYGIKEFLI